jgi:hypothetical protein
MLPSPRLELRKIMAHFHYPKIRQRNKALPADAGSISHVGDAASVGKHDHLGSRRTSPVCNHRAAIQPIRTPTHRA